MNLSDELRTHIDRVAPPLTMAEVVTRAVPEPEAGPPGRTERGPTLRWLVVAAALTLAVAGGLVLVPGPATTVTGNRSRPTASACRP